MIQCACSVKKLSGKAVILSIKKSRSVRALKRALGGLDARDLDCEMIRQSRAIAAIEPIKANTIFIADSVGGVDRERPNSGLVLAVSVRFQIGAHREFPLV